MSCYVVRASYVGGDGLFATTPIAAGAKILEETPLLCVRKQQSNDVMDMFDDIWYAYLRLDSAKKATYKGLHPANTGDSLQAIGWRFLQNAWGIEGGPSSGVFAQICKANHSCEPNAEFEYDYSRGVGILTAVRDIALNEEISVAYIDLDMERIERQHALSSWGFLCLCQKCLAEKEEQQMQNLEIKMDNVG